MIYNAKEQVERYFRSNRWNVLDALDGGVLFYKKRCPSQVKKYEFLSYSKKKEALSSLDIINQLESFFLPLRYQKKQSSEIVRPRDSSTFFITSGIQVFEEDLLKGDLLNVTDSLFVQPVIRTNYVKSLGEGNISSFVNPSTLRFNCSPNQYVEDLDAWMTFLSKIGLYLGDFICKLRDKKKNQSSYNFWKRNEGFVLTFLYGGLGLGDAGYCTTPNNQTPFEDIGFGLERLLWARNKNYSFREIIGLLPYAFYQDIKTIDTLRTLTLMAMFNINTNEDSYNQFKKYVSNLDFQCSDLEPQISAYYNFWNQFISPQKAKQETVEYLIKNINKAKNTTILSELGLNNFPKELKKMVSADQDLFLRHLIKLEPGKILLLRDLYKR